MFNRLSARSGKALAKKWDAIIIGAGLGGLASALTLCEAGLEVLVLEQCPGPGGYARDFCRHDYRFDVSLRSMAGMAEGGEGHDACCELGIADALDFRRLDPDYVARLPGVSFSAPAHPNRYENELIATFPAERAGIRRLTRAMLNLYHEQRQARADLSDRCSAGATIRGYPNLMRAAGMSWHDFLRQFVSDSALLALLGVSWLQCGLPPSRLNALAMAVHWVGRHWFGCHYPMGGPAAVTAALVASIRKHGGALRFGSLVTWLDVRHGIIEGVRTADGESEQSRMVISNSAAPRTLLAMLPPDAIPRGYAHRIRHTQASLSSLNVYLGINRRADFCFPAHELLTSDLLDPEDQYRAVVAGDWERMPFRLFNYGIADPACAPAAKTVLRIMALAPWNYADTWGTHNRIDRYPLRPEYNHLKREAAATLVARAERHIVGLRKAIEVTEVATPLTNYRRTKNHHGAIFGCERSLDAMFLTRLPYRTVVPNLLITGAWTGQDTGQTAALVSGIEVGREAIRLLKQKALPAPVRLPPSSGPHDTGLVGSALPPFTVTAFDSERQFSHQSAGERPLVVLFQSVDSAPLALAAATAIRERFPLTRQLLILHLVAAGEPGKSVRMNLTRRLDGVRTKATAALPSTVDPADYVAICPDWGDAVTRACGIAPETLNDAVVAIVADRAGEVRAMYTGDGIGDDACLLLEWL